MKILVVCQYYYPEEFQINAVCEELVKRGNQVTVLTGLPNYPTGVVPQEYQHGNKRQEFVNGVEVIRCYEKSRKKGIVGLGLNYASYCLSASVKALSLQGDYDVVYVYQLSPVLMAIPGIIYKKMHSKELYLYCCDLWPDSLKIMHIKENSLIFKLIKTISSFIYSSANTVGIQAPAFFSYFEQTHKLQRDKLVYLPQFATDENTVRDYNIAHQGFNFVFMGNIGIAQSLDTVVQAVELLKGKFEFQVHIVGDGSYLEDLKRMVHDKAVESYFVFYGRKPLKDMSKYYEIADVCLLTLAGDSIIGHTIPSKLQGYMAAGKPIVGAIDGSAQTVIKEAKCGLAGAAGDYRRLADNMMTLLNNRGRLAQYGENGRAYFKANFTKQLYVDKTIKILNNLVGAD